MTKGDDMPVTWEKARLNVWHISAIMLSIAVNAGGAAFVWNDTKRDIQDTQDDMKTLQASVTDIQKQLPQITQLQFQVTRAVEQISENKAGIVAVNSRADRIVESLGGKLDTLVDSVNKIATRVEVLNSKLEDAAGKADRTRFNMPILKR
jgi:peptidoglycan hydrolase CwlO-like protein